MRCEITASVALERPISAPEEGRKAESGAKFYGDSHKDNCFYGEVAQFDSRLGFWQNGDKLRPHYVNTPG